MGRGSHARRWLTQGDIPPPMGESVGREITDDIGCDPLERQNSPDQVYRKLFFGFFTFGWRLNLVNRRGTVGGGGCERRWTGKREDDGQERCPGPYAEGITQTKMFDPNAE